MKVTEMAMKWFIYKGFLFVLTLSILLGACTPRELETGVPVTPEPAGSFFIRCRLLGTTVVGGESIIEFPNPVGRETNPLAYCQVELAKDDSHSEINRPGRHRLLEAYLIDSNGVVVQTMTPTLPTAEPD